MRCTKNAPPHFIIVPFLSRDFRYNKDIKEREGSKMLFDFDFNEDGELDAFERTAAYHCYEETTSEESDDWDCGKDSYTFDWDFD